MGLSKELQIGKAGEHMVCCDLLLQGFNSFLSDQGLPFDILVEKNGDLKKIQVRATKGLSTWGKTKDIYRFGTRKGKGSVARAREAEVDYYAFVALDIRQVAYVSIKEMLARGGKVKQTMDFKSRNIKYSGRVYSNGTIRKPEWGKYFQDYGKFK